MRRYEGNRVLDMLLDPHICDLTKDLTLPYGRIRLNIELPLNRKYEDGGMTHGNE